MNALSLGANNVMPPLVVNSWEFIWFATWVVLSRRINVVKPPALLRILMMSVGGDDGTGAEAAAAGAAAGD